MAIEITKYPSNVNPIDVNAYAAKDINKYFNNYFDQQFEVSSNINDAILAYFEQIADNKDAARALASAVIYTSIKQGLNPMETLKEFAKLPAGELDAYTAMFLNFERKGTSYLGIINHPPINKYVQRAILP